MSGYHKALIRSRSRPHVRKTSDNQINKLSSWVYKMKKFLHNEKRILQTPEKSLLVNRKPMGSMIFHIQRLRNKRRNNSQICRASMKRRERSN